MVATFSDTQAALRMREFVKSVAISQINKMRPEERVGKVYSYNPSTQLAEIYFPGDDVNSLLVARFANDKIPTVSMIETYDEFGLEAEGNLVRIAGTPGAYYISDYVSGIPAVDPSARALVAKNTTVLKDDIGVVDTKVEAVKVTSDQAAADIIVLNTSTLPALQGDIGNAQLEIDALNNVTIPALNLELATAQQDLDTLQTVTIPSINSDISGIQTDITTLDSLVSAVEGDINTLETVTIPGLNSELDQAQSDIASFQSSQDLHFSILQAHQADINTLENTTIPNLNTQLTAANNEIAQRTKVSFATTQPTGLLSTDRVIWYDSDNGYTASYWNGTSWGPYQLSGAAILSGGIVTTHMAAGSINGDRITAATLNADRIVAGSITTDRMTANTINGDRVTANTLNASKIVAGSITTDRMTANTILGDRIQANTLNADRIVAGSITTDRMTANTINGDRITTNTLNADRIVAGSITGDRIQAGAITANKLSVIVGGGNLVPDSSFETDPTSWTVSAPGTLTWNTTTPRRGTRSPRITRTAAGDLYFASPWDIPNAELVGKTITLSWDWKASANGVVPSGGPAVQASTYHGAGYNAGPTTEWTRAWGTITIPTTPTGNFRIILRGSNVNGEWIEYDGIQVELGDIPTSYAPKVDEILPGTIQTNHMTANTINGDRVTANTLNASKIIAGTITTDRMTANTIDGDRITANTLNASKIIAGSITSDRITVNTLSGDRITTNTLNGDKVITNTLHADKIQSNTITGDKIVAGTISARHVTIGAVDNYAIDIQAAANRTAYVPPANFSWNITGEAAGPARIRVDPPAANTYRSFVISELFATSPDDEFYIEFDAYTGFVNYSVGIGLLSCNADGTTIGEPVAPANGVLVPTSAQDLAWVHHTGSAKVQAGSSAAKVVVFVPAQATAPSGVYYIRGIKVFKKATGDLIVNGSITADKLDADAINGKTITGVTITGGTVTGGVIRTSSGLPRVEISNLGGWTDRIRWYGANGTETYINGDNNGLYLKGTGNSAIHLTNSGGGNVSLIGSRIDVVGGPLKINVGAILHNFSTYEVQMNQTFGGSDWWIHNTANNRTLWQYSDGWYSTEGSMSIGCLFYGGFVNWSDIKDKSDLKPANSGLADIRQLPVFDYDTKHGGAAKKKGEKNRLVRKRGVIAQDLQKVAPHLVIEDKVDPDDLGEDGVQREPFGLGVDIYGLLSTAIAAIRELDEEVTRLKESIK